MPLPILLAQFRLRILNFSNIRYCTHLGRLRSLAVCLPIGDTLLVLAPVFVYGWKWCFYLRSLYWFSTPKTG